MQLLREDIQSMFLAALEERRVKAAEEGQIDNGQMSEGSDFCCAICGLQVDKRCANDFSSAKNCCRSCGAMVTMGFDPATGKFSP